MPREERVNAKHTIVEKFRHLLKSTSHPEEKVTLIKAMGNTGLPDFVFDLQQIAEDQTQPEVTRAKAIYSLRKLTPLAAKKVKNFIMRVVL